MLAAIDTDQSNRIRKEAEAWKIDIKEPIASGSRIILIQPSIYDATVVMPDKPDTREGVWSVEIDDQKCGEYSSAEFSAGINLATNTNTPQYKQ